MKPNLYTASNQLIDLLTGYPVNNGTDKIMETEHWSKAQIISDQQKKFEKLTEIASKSDYYKKYKSKSLNEFPVMNRDEFKINLSRIKTNYRGSYLIQHSSGSTSIPVTLLISKEMLLAKRVSHQKMLRWYGLTRESSELKLGGIKQNLPVILYYYLKNKRYYDSFQIREENMDSIVRKYNTFHPDILYGYPSAIYRFIKYSGIRNYRLHEPEVICTHAENLYNEIVEEFSRFFPKTNIVNQYWATEANIAVTCPAGNLHIDEDTIICEVINPDKHGLGDLLITNLYSYHQPIIRYKIGDKVKLSSHECQCGRKTRIIERIEGREIDTIILPDGRVIPVTAFHLANYADNIISYQLIFHKAAKSIEFCYKPIQGNQPVNKNGITEYFRKDFGLSVYFTVTDRLELTPGGKFKKLIIKE
jgi:phenylacetate-CoA ligase